MIDITWLDEQRSIFGWTFSNDWTWDEFYHAHKQTSAMIDEVDGIVDGIIIPSSKPHMPPYAPMHLSHVLSTTHPRLDKLVVVAPRMFLTSMLSAVGQMLPELPSHFHYARSLEEAFTYVSARQMERHQTPSKT